jgi:hypothetical protein
MKLGSIAVLLALVMVSPAFAHGDKKHVVGTIDKVSVDAVMVKTKEGKTVEVKLAPTTTYVTSDDKPAKFADLAVGQRVVIHADSKGTDLIAATVKFAAAGSVASPKPAVKE